MNTCHTSCQPGRHSTASLAALSENSVAHMSRLCDKKHIGGRDGHGVGNCSKQQSVCRKSHLGVGIVSDHFDKRPARVTAPNKLFQLGYQCLLRLRIRFRADSVAKLLHLGAHGRFRCRELHSVCRGTTRRKLRGSRPATPLGFSAR